MSARGSRGPRVTSRLFVLLCCQSKADHIISYDGKYQFRGILIMSTDSRSEACVFKSRRGQISMIITPPPQFYTYSTNKRSEYENIFNLFFPHFDHKPSTHDSFTRDSNIRLLNTIMFFFAHHLYCLAF